jgi:tetratricopeptide (TPR) repeat protein
VEEKTNYSSLAALLAKALSAQHRYDEAEAFTRASERASRANDVLANVIWRSARATALAGQGQLEAAHELARDAVRFAGESDFLSAHGDALLDLGHILRLAGRHREATEAIERAIDLYEQKGNVVSVARARSLLDVSV